MLSALSTLFQKSVSGLGFEFLGVELLAECQPPTLRLYIDHPNGVTVENCAVVTRHVSVLLDVEDPIAFNYVLEVSSPGQERPLFTQEHYHHALGCMVALSLRVASQGRQRLEGKLLRVEAEEICLDIGAESLIVPLRHIERAHLVGKIA